MEGTRQIHVIDDDEAVRDSLGFLLEAAGFEVNTYDCGVAFLEGRSGQETGCIVTDVRMPGITGLELVIRLRQLGCGLPIIVMTGHADVQLAVQAMKAGAHDFIEKPFDESVLLQTVETALARSVAANGASGERNDALSRIESLSARERQVLRGLVAGKPNKAMARDFGISPRTVEVYRANLMTKLNAASLSEVVRLAVRAGELE
ncbi:MAG TPA: response regulator FixJ [Caulobacteraceae bacterium]|nr:response regulator FixJ [Caulobacteraceae bacterium]